MARVDWGTADDLEGSESVDLNLTSLIDVVLVLLIIFMVSTAAVVTDQGQRDADAATALDLQLPSGMVPSDQPPAQDLVVKMTKDGALYNAGTATDPKTLEQDVMDRLTKEPNLQVRIEADQELKYLQVAELLGKLQALGVKNVSLGMGNKAK